MNRPCAQRIQKVLAAAGFGSRRACEELVRDGRVSINGNVVTDLPVLVDPAVDDVRVDGRRLRPERKVYYLLHKPKGVLSTNRDPRGRRRAVDLLHGVRERVFPVGRLDAGTTGLLLMTNDGELADRLTHPRYGVNKTYSAEVAGPLGAEELEKLRRGIWLAGGRTQAARVRVVDRGPKAMRLEITLREGRNREVRRMLASLGHKVSQLKRIRMGSLSLRGVGVGKYRPLSPGEVSALKAVASRSVPRALGAAR